MLLSDLPNIGKETERQLMQAGINNPEELRLAGSKEAWLRIFAFDPSACYNRLLGLEGAVRGVRKKELSESVRLELKEFYILAKKGS